MTQDNRNPGHDGEESGRDGKGWGVLSEPVFRLRRWLLGPGPVLDRLSSEIDALDEWHRRLEARGQVDDTPDFDQHLASAQCFLEAARTARDRNHVDKGWRAVHDARRELFQLESAPELHLLAMELRKECGEKLQDWRKAAAADLLPHFEPSLALFPPDLRERVVEAQRILDGHSDNVYFKQRYRQMQMLLLKWHLVSSTVAILLVSLMGWPVATANRWYDPESGIQTGSLSSLIETVEASTEPEPEDAGGRQAGDAGSGRERDRDGDEAGSGAGDERTGKRGKTNALDLVFAVLLFGWLGGSFSALSSLARTNGERKIPRLTMDSRVTLMRPLMGAVGAFIVFVTLLAGFPVEGWISNPSVLVFALAAGFSERLAVRGVERVAGSNS